MILTLWWLNCCCYNFNNFYFEILLKEHGSTTTYCENGLFLFRFKMTFLYLSKLYLLWGQLYCHTPADFDKSHICVYFFLKVKCVIFELPKIIVKIKTVFKQVSQTIPLLKIGSTRRVSPTPNSFLHLSMFTLFREISLQTYYLNKI